VVVHNVPTVVYTPNAHNLCGAFSYTPLYEGAPLSGDDPVHSYTDSSRTFNFYSTNYDLVGQTKDYGILAQWATYPTAVFPNASSSLSEGPLTFYPPCLNP